MATNMQIHTESSTKQNGAGTFDHEVDIEPTTNLGYNDHHALNHIIDDALQHHHFAMAYQPIFCVHNSRLIGFESLVRCFSPKFGFVPPDVFIPHAEETGRMLDVGDWIFCQALLDLSRLRKQGFTNICLSLNVSPLQILSADIFERVMTLANKYDIPPKCIKLELTETALIKGYDTIHKTFDAFQAEGVQVWLDDFGTGFSSLSLLRKFKIDGLKIDRSFVEGIGEDNNDFTLCSAIIAMAQRLGMTTVAEGIETQTQLQILSQMGCDSAQGYLLGKPESLERNIELYRQ